jgi:hypothetical protein
VSLLVPSFRITSAYASNTCKYAPSGNPLVDLFTFESIRCQRLSLTPLSYLWQRDQAELLSEMIAAGMEAILIKVAGIGLTTKHLGRTLTAMQPTLTKLVSEAFLVID